MPFRSLRPKSSRERMNYVTIYPDEDVTGESFVVPGLLQGENRHGY